MFLENFKKNRPDLMLVISELLERTRMINRRGLAGDIKVLVQPHSHYTQSHYTQSKSRRAGGQARWPEARDVRTRDTHERSVCKSETEAS